VGLLDPAPPPYAPLEWLKKPLGERARMVCEAWALQGYGTPVAVYVVYVVKLALYVAGWRAFCRFGPGDDWLHPVAFQKAIVWSMLFEVLGLGCGSGPLTGRYYPPVGGFLYFLRPGTTKLPLFPGAPLIGAVRRGVLDVAAYAALLVLAARALVAAEPGFAHFAALAGALGLCGVLDKTLFLAARAEHYGTTVVCFLWRDWLPGAMTVQLALWFWAGFSKLNHHFPTVACVMTSNGPILRSQWLRKRMYRDYPRDLRPSRLAAWLAHGGTLLEFAVPVAFVLTPRGVAPVAAIALMIALHVYIVQNVPMGVPIEWNAMVAYAGFALFWAHPEVRPWDAAVPLGALTVAAAWLLPLAGNLFPSRISFLLAMRYYAGNWAFSIWLLRGEAYKKLERLTTSAGWIYDQLARFYDRATAVGLVGKVMAFRLMHLHGRALPALVPKAVERFEDYEWLDGEIVAGLVLGYNFGEGHLHQEQLLAAVQAQCSFEPGELRCIFVESQPLGQGELEWRIADAATGTLERGALPVAELRARQPWGD
jgi:hypothetical protein